MTLHGLPDLSAPVAGVVIGVTSVVSPGVFAPETVVEPALLAENLIEHRVDNPDLIRHSSQMDVSATGGHVSGWPGQPDAVPDELASTAPARVTVVRTELATDGPGDHEWEEERDRISGMPIHFGYDDWGVGIDPGTPEGTSGFLKEQIDGSLSGEGGVWDGAPVELELYPERALSGDES